MMMKIQGIALFLFCFVGMMNAQERAVTLSGDTIFIYMDGRWTYEERTQEEMQEPEEKKKMEWVIDTSFSEFFSSATADKLIDRPVDFFTLQYEDKFWKRLPPAAIHPRASHAFELDRDDVQVFLIVDTVDVGLERAFKAAMETILENPDSDLNVSLSELRSVNGEDMIFADYTLVASDMEFRFNTYFYSGPDGTIQYNAYAPVDVFADNELYVEEMLHGLTIKEKEIIEKKVADDKENRVKELATPPVKSDIIKKPTAQKKPAEQSKKRERNSIFYGN